MLIESDKIDPSRPRYLHQNHSFKAFKKKSNHFCAYLSSANSATNKTIKLIEPPAVKPDKNLAQSTSVTFVAYNLKNQAA